MVALVVVSLYIIVMKKSFLTILLIFLLFSVFAIDAETMMEKAKSSSQLFKSVENSYKSSLNNLRLKDLASAGAGVTASVQHKQKIDEFAKAYPSANVTVTLPEFIDDLGISVSVSETKMESVAALAMAGYQDLLTGITEDVSGMFIQPGLQISKVFDFSSGEAKGASDKIAKIQVELAHDSGVIQFENNLIDAVIKIMEAEQSLKTNKKNLERSKEDYNNSIELGQIDKDSVTDLNIRMNLASAESAISSLISSLDSMKKSFKNSYGFDYEPVTSVSDTVLSFTKSDSGNSSVVLSYLSLLDAQYKYNKAAGKTSGLTLSGNVGVPFLLTEGDAKNVYAVNADASLAFTSGNFSLSAKAETRYFDDKFSTPTVTIAGGWGKNEASDINIDNLSLGVIEAQNDYDSALNKYNVSVLGIQTEIDSFNAEKEKFEIEKKYHKQVYEYQKKLYDMGFISYRDYSDACDDYEADKVNAVIMGLKAMKISNDIKAISL